jgi:hypothetical protein
LQYQDRETCPAGGYHHWHLVRFENVVVPESQMGQRDPYYSRFLGRVRHYWCRKCDETVETFTPAA